MAKAAPAPVNPIPAAGSSPSDPGPKKEAGQKDRLKKIEKKLGVIEKELDPGQPAAPAPGAVIEPGKDPAPADPGAGISPSGVLKILYLAVLDQLCDLTGKERFTAQQKQQIVEELDEDLSAIDSKWIAPLVGDRPEVRIITKTGMAWFGQKDKALSPLPPVDPTVPAGPAASTQ